MIPTKIQMPTTTLESALLEGGKVPNPVAPEENILKNAETPDSAEFYLDAARALSSSLSKVNNQLVSQSGAFSDISSIVSNKATIVTKIVSLVEKSWEKKRGSSGDVKEATIREVLDKLVKVFDSSDIPQDVRDKFFMELSSNE